MPPRKSVNDSIVSNGPTEDGQPQPAEGTTPAPKAPKDGMSVEDLSLPKSMIQRLAKGVLPPNTQIQKDALLALHKSTTVFVSYIADAANLNASKNGKRTIQPTDIAEVLKDCEFEDFLPRVEAELKKYNDMQCDKRNTYRRKVKEEQKAAAGPAAPAPGNPSAEGDTTLEGDTTTEMDVTTGAAIPSTNGHINMEDLDRPAKKLKAEDGSAVPPDGDMTDDEMTGMQDDVDADADDDVDDDEDDVEDEGGDEVEHDVEEMDDGERDRAAQLGFDKDEALDEEEDSD